jgi:hypothetical protein
VSSIVALRELLLLLVAVAVEDLREGRARGEHVDGRVGAEHHLGERPDQRGRRTDAAEVGREREGVPAAVDVRREALLEAVGDRDRAGLGVEDRRVAVGVDERRGEVVGGEALDLAQQVLGRVDVELPERLGAQRRIGAEDLEQVELDVAQVALVVTHDCSGLRSSDGPAHRCTRR